MLHFTSSLDAIEKIETDLIQNIKNDFDKQKYISYLDELEIDTNGEKLIAISSFTASRNYYISEIEPKWIEIRKKYNVPKGLPLHFATIRTILSEVKYPISETEHATSYGWDAKYFHHRYNKLFTSLKPDQKNPKNRDLKKIKEHYDIWKIFSKKTDDNIVVDMELAESFFNDVVNCISHLEIDIICTGIRYNKESSQLLRDGRTSDTKSPYFLAFSEHLNLLTFYLTNSYLDSKERKSMLKKITKLRIDGDDGSRRQEIRRAYNNAVNFGTTHFSGRLIYDSIDEIRFINKAEVGYFDEQEDPSEHKIISHIGCDIMDFIARYIGRHVFKEVLIAADKKNDLQMAKKSFEDSMMLSINGKEIDVFNGCIKDKIIEKNNHQTLQIFDDCNFYFEI